jgi:uncharacterized protein YegL
VSEFPVADGSIVLPVYLVIDTSASLRGEIDSVNEALASLLHSLVVNPALEDIVRISLIEFSDGARTAMPLSQVSETTQAPVLVAGGSTNYSAVFDLVRQVIPTDVADLKRHSYRVFRPVMFFITDGSPTDLGWQAALEELRSPEFRLRPTIVAIGFGSADPAIIGEIGSGKGSAFMISDAISTREAVDSIGSALPKMLVSTVTSTRTPGGTLPASVPAPWLNLR